MSVLHRSEVSFGVDRSNSSRMYITLNFVFLLLSPFIWHFVIARDLTKSLKRRRFAAESRRAIRSSDSRDEKQRPRTRCRRETRDAYTSAWSRHEILGNRRESNCDAARAAYRSRHAFGGSDRARSTESRPVALPPPPTPHPARPNGTRADRDSGPARVYS